MCCALLSASRLWARRSRITDSVRWNITLEGLATPRHRFRTFSRPELDSAKGVGRCCFAEYPAMAKVPSDANDAASTTERTLDPD